MKLSKTFGERLVQTLSVRLSGTEYDLPGIEITLPTFVIKHVPILISIRERISSKIRSPTHNSLKGGDEKETFSC